MAQQPGDFKEIGFFAQLLDGIASISQNRVLAVDVGDLRFALRSGQEARIERDPAIVVQRGYHDAVRACRGLDHRQGEVL